MPKVTLGDVAREFKDSYKGDKSSLPIVGLEHLKLITWKDDLVNSQFIRQQFKRKWMEKLTRYSCRIGGLNYGQI